MEDIIKESKKEYYRLKAEKEEQEKRIKARIDSYQNALTIKKFNELIRPLDANELSRENKELIIDLHLKSEETQKHWFEFAESMLDGSNYDKYKEDRAESPFFQELYRQITNHLAYFFPNKDIAFNECDIIDRNAMNICFQLEHSNAEDVIDEFCEMNNFVKFVKLKYLSSLLANPAMKSNLDYNLQHDFFQLWSERESSNISTLGLKFCKTDNVLGWEILKVENFEEVSKPVEKIDWQGNQALLAFLFRQLENKGVISNKNYLEYISNHFTVNGNEINRNSLKTAVHKARLDIKNFQDKKPIEKQIENVAVRIPVLIDILNELERDLTQ
jgi:hypothetical protein